MLVICLLKLHKYNRHENVCQVPVWGNMKVECGLVRWGGADAAANYVTGKNC